MCKTYARSKGGSRKMTEVHSVKLDRSAFNRGVEDMITLRPLRDVVSAFVRSASKSGAVVATEKYAKGRTPHVKKRQATSSK